jgi:hypothetical protein
MADKKFTLGIETTADTSGAEKTVDAMDAVVDKGRELENALEPTPGGGLEQIPAAATPAAKAIDNLGDEARRTERELDALETQSRKVGQELARTGNTSEGVSSKLGGKLTGTIQQAGFQIQDFAVQVGGGTSAMTAFGQQAPQFLGAFGPAGSIAGAIISIGAVAFNVFSKMGEDIQDPKEKLEEMNDVIAKIAKNKTDELNQEFADTAAAFDLAARRAAALKTGIDDVVKSENKLALAQLERRALERESATAAANKKAVAEGKPADTQRVANDAALRVQERAAELARQGVAAEQSKVAAAQSAAQIKAAELKAAETARLKAIDLLEVERKRIEVLRQQEDFLKKFARGEGFLNQRPAIPGFEEIITDETSKPQSGKAAIDQIRTRGKALAEGAGIQSNLKAAEARIAALEQKLTGDDAELNKAIADLSVELLAAQTNVANQVKAARNNAAAITLDLGTVDLGQQSKRNAAAEAGVEASKTNVVGQLEGLVAGIGEGGGKDLAPFITEMKTILQDKALSADELARLPALLQQYLGKVANLGAAQNTAIRDASSRMDELEREMRNLKSTAGARNP